MIRFAPILALIPLSLAGSAGAQDYYNTTAEAQHGYGSDPATVVAGQLRMHDFTVIAIAPEGERVAGVASEVQWKATVTTGPNPELEGEEIEDERYLNTETRVARTAEEEAAAAAAADIPRTERVYSSLTCPAIVARMQALKPLTTFEFNPPSLEGNRDGPAGGDGHQGFDLSLHVGGAQLIKSAESADSELGRWFVETTRAIGACAPRSGPAASAPAAGPRP